MERIHLSKPHIGEAELAFVRDAFETNWMSTVGPNLDAFESELGAVLERPCVALSSGTAGLHLALRLVGARPGDRVLCPTLTFVATANPILYVGATPHFVDSERESWNVDPNLVEDAIRTGPRPRAIIVVHLYGQPANLGPLVELSRRHDVPLIEDAAPAMGTLYEGRHVGSFGAVGVVSFNGNKIITTTGGGALCGEAHDVDKARFWATQAKDAGLGYEHSEVGHNYRMSNVLAGIGRGQLAVLEDRVARRRAVSDRYAQAFADLPGLARQPEAAFGRHSRWLSCFLVDSDALGVTRDDLVHGLDAANIEARPVWKPMHLQRLFRDATVTGGDVAADLHRRGLCLPSSSNLTADEQARVIEVVRRVVEGRGAGGV